MNRKGFGFAAAKTKFRGTVAKNSKLPLTVQQVRPRISRASTYGNAVHDCHSQKRALVPPEQRRVQQLHPFSPSGMVQNLFDRGFSQQLLEQTENSFGCLLSISRTVA